MTPVVIRSDLTALGAGDAIVVTDSQFRGKYHHRHVAHVGRVWLTDTGGWRFRRTDGEGEARLQVGYGVCALTVADWQVTEETERLTERLRAWGWVPRLSLTLDQLRRAAALVSEFESENNGGLL